RRAPYHPSLRKARLRFLERERHRGPSASIWQPGRPGTALERGELWGGEERGGAAHMVEHAVIEQHEGEGEHRFVPGEVAVPIAIDRNVQMSREQGPGEERLQAVELLVDIGHLLISQRMQRDQRTTQDAGRVVERIHSIDHARIGSLALDEDVQQDVVAGSCIPPETVVEWKPAERLRPVSEIDDV